MRKPYQAKEYEVKPEDVAPIVKPEQKGPTIYRTCIAIFVVVLAVVMLSVIAATSGSYHTFGKKFPKVVVINVDGLTPDILSFAMASNKAPFLKQLVAMGAAYAAVPAGGIGAPATMTAAQVGLLTGVDPTVAGVNTERDMIKMMNNNMTTFLRNARQSETRTMIVAPDYMFSGTTFTDGMCSPTGLLDAECLGFACSLNDTQSYCNAEWRAAVCEDNSIDTRNEDYVYTKIEAAASLGYQLIYAQTASFNRASQDKSVNSLSALSETYVMDAFVGRVASLLAERSASRPENWLLVVTSEGFTTGMAPLFIAGFNKGYPLRMLPIANGTRSNASTLDVFPTVTAWLDLDVTTQSHVPVTKTPVVKGTPTGRLTGNVQGICQVGSLANADCH